MRVVRRLFDISRKKLHNRSFLKNTLVVAGGTTIAQLLAVIVMPILSRLFTPEDFGILTLYSSALAILVPFVTMKYDLAIPLEQDEKGAINVFFLSITCTVLLSSVIMLFVMFSAEEFSKMLNVSDFAPYVWLLPIGTAAVGFYTSSLSLALYNRSYRDITKTKIVQGIVRSTIQVSFGVVSLGGPLGLILGEISGQTCGVRVLIRPLFRLRRYTLKDLSLTSIKTLAKKYRKFPLISSPSAFLQGIGSQISIFLLTALYGTEVTGSFGFAQRIIAAPLMLIGIAIGQVYFAEGAKLRREDPISVYKLTVKIAKKLLIVGGIIAGILMLFGPSIFELVFGAPWREAGEYARILSLMLMARFVVFPISSALIIVERQGLQFLLDLLRSIVVVVAIYCSKIFMLDALGAIISYTVAMTAVYLTTYIVIMNELKKGTVS